MILGGGRAFFLPNSTKDPETNKVHYWQRQDGLNLIEVRFLNKRSMGFNSKLFLKYVCTYLS